MRRQEIRRPHGRSWLAVPVCRNRDRNDSRSRRIPRPCKSAQSQWCECSECDGANQLSRLCLEHVDAAYTVKYRKFHSRISNYFSAIQCKNFDTSVRTESFVASNVSRECSFDMINFPFLSDITIVSYTAIDKERS